MRDSQGSGLLVKEKAADGKAGVRREAAGHAPRRGGAGLRATSDAVLSDAFLGDTFPLGILVLDARGRCVYSNSAYQRISGLAFAQAPGAAWSMVVHPEDRQRFLAEWRDATRAGERLQTECRFLRGDGSVVWVRVNGAAMRDGTQARGYVQTVEDISARKSKELVSRAAETTLPTPAASPERERRAELTLDAIGEAVLTTDLSGHVTYLNRMGETMTGWARDDALGRPLAEVFRIVNGTTGQVAEDPAQRAVVEDRTVVLATDCVLVRRDGKECAIEDSAAPIHDRHGRVAGAVIVFHDVSRSLATALKMSHLAQHDALTGLPNRLLLSERLSQAIGLARRHRRQVALLFLDLDGFKRVNDTLGHAVGDRLLQSVADRLVQCVRATDTVCRHGGDEFVILLAEIERPRDAAKVAGKLRAALAAPHLAGGHALHVTASIGIGIYPDDGTDADTVMQNADAAMYRAKAAGRNHYEFFSACASSRGPLPGKAMDRVADPFT